MKHVPSTKSVSLAVLPFEDLSKKDEFEYFSKGLVEELIIDLSHFNPIQIISSYTSSRLIDPDLDEIDAAKRIEIDFLLKGTLHLQGNTMRLNTQLLDTGSREIIWAERFESPREEIFDIQESIVERVVYTISAEVENNKLASAREKPVTSLAAYDCWLRGMAKLRQGSLEADHEARDLFNQALSIDPYYSRAYVGLSLSHFNEWTCQLWELFEESEESAFKYAGKAFALDDSDHIAQMILGRVYLYRRQFDLAEHHINRSLELNRNDADCLVQLASCMAFMGRAAEGERLFDRALRLNPYRNLWYYQYGSLAYFVQRKFRKSIEMALKRQLTNVWVDLPGYIGAAYAHLGEKEMARKYITLFIEHFTVSISRGRTPQAEEIIEWVKQANPFKYKEDMDCVVEGLVLAGIEPVLMAGKEGILMQGNNGSIQLPSIFKKEQAIWHLEFEGMEITMPDLKGFHDIAKLLAYPESEVHCTELMGSQASMDENEFTLDEKARSAYENHIKDLQSEISEADENNDLGRKHKLQGELEQIIEHLSKNLGVNNRPRKLKSPAERARAAVTLRIRGAIKKISSYHPSLAKHLTNSIRTGVFCSYSPEEEREWILH